MNQVGRIKLMSKKLTAAEMNKLSIWLKEKAMVRSKEERINDIISLGLGGRVVYAAGNSTYDVTGIMGSIVKIRKKKRSEQYLIDVTFDQVVYKTPYAVDTQEFLNWKHKKQENLNFYKEIKQKYSSPKAKMNKWDQWMQEEYRFETGKEPKETRIREGKTLVHIAPLLLKPATEENVKAALRLRESMPMMAELNKIVSNAIRG